MILAIWAISITLRLGKNCCYITQTIYQLPLMFHCVPSLQCEHCRLEQASNHKNLSQSSSLISHQSVVHPRIADFISSKATTKRLCEVQIILIFHVRVRIEHHQQVQEHDDEDKDKKGGREGHGRVTSV